MKDIKINYMLARLPMGMSLFGHGLVRLPKLTLFSEWMVSSFINRMGRIYRIISLPGF